MDTDLFDKTNKILWEADPEKKTQILNDLPTLDIQTKIQLFRILFKTCEIFKIVLGISQEPFNSEKVKELISGLNFNHTEFVIWCATQEKVFLALKKLDLDVDYTIICHKTPYKSEEFFEFIKNKVEEIYPIPEWCFPLREDPIDLTNFREDLFHPSSIALNVPGKGKILAVSIERMEPNPDDFYHQVDKILGPVNAKTLEYCNSNRNCRMFECECKNSDWFTGECEICNQIITCKYFSLRYPVRNGGWYGCFCSKFCLDKFVRLAEEKEFGFSGLEDKVYDPVEQCRLDIFMNILKQNTVLYSIDKN